jgi:5'-deoxynucleotidase
MFYNILSRLKLIQRWALVYTTIPENVAEHSWDVAVLGHLLACISNTHFKGAYVDPCLVATTALYHDSTEALTGDLPTPIKYHSKGMTAAYKRLETGASKRLLSSIPKELQHFYKDILLETLPEDVHRLVKAADKLAAYLKAKAEVERGNKDFRLTLQHTEEAALNLNSPEITYFLNHIHQGTEHEQ